MKTAGQLMQEIRKNKGLTQDQVATKMGVKRATYAQYESDNRTPKYETVQKIAAALDVPPAFFYPIDEQIETAKREAQAELWAAETHASDSGEPWDVPTYNRQREVIILNMASRYSVAPDILFAFIPQRTENEYSKDTIYIDATHTGSAKNKARGLFKSLKTDIQRKAAVQIAIDDIWNAYGHKPIPTFERILKAYEENDAHALKLVEDLEALVYGTSAGSDDKEPTEK